MPDTGLFSYVVQWFIDLGLDFNYSELDSWNKLTGVNVTSWEAETLVKMSRKYNSGLMSYKKPDAIAPYMVDNMTGEERGKMLLDKFKKFANKVNKK